jgi:hypothetical protein
MDANTTTYPCLPVLITNPVTMQGSVAHVFTEYDTAVEFSIKQMTREILDSPLRDKISLTARDPVSQFESNRLASEITKYSDEMKGCKKAMPFIYKVSWAQCEMPRKLE